MFEVNREARGRLWSVWKRATALAIPVGGEALLRTLMRTTDVIVAGALSPASVAAVGVGDSFSRILNRVAGGIGDGTIALSSQDTGAAAYANRDEAITTSFILGFLIGLPFMAFGILFSEEAIRILGAENEVVRLGGQYLMIIMIGAPAIHLTKIGSKALQGTGDTKTPMYVRGIGNSLNILGTLSLAFGLGPFPRMGVFGIGLATVFGETISTLLFMGVIQFRRDDIGFVRPKQLTIAKQVVSIGWPRIGEGLAVMIADLPFNAVLFAIGTEANAAYHIGRRAYQQILAPARRGYSIASNIFVGQSLEQDPRKAYYEGAVTVGLAIIVTGLFGSFLFFGDWLIVGIFTDDPATAVYATGFVKAYAVLGLFHAGSDTVRGGLRGGSDTRNPFIATVIGRFAFFLGLSYIGVMYLGYGIFVVWVGMVLDHVWRLGHMSVIFYRRKWIAHGQQLMQDRGSMDVSTDSGD